MNFKRKYSKKRCFICKNKIEIDYKDVEFLKKYIGINSKIKPRKITGICAKHQKHIAKEIKKARNIALLPFI